MKVWILAACLTLPALGFADQLEDDLDIGAEVEELELYDQHQAALDAHQEALTSEQRTQELERHIRSLKKENAKLSKKIKKENKAFAKAAKVERKNERQAQVLAAQQSILAARLAKLRQKDVRYNEPIVQQRVAHSSEDPEAQDKRDEADLEQEL